MPKEFSTGLILTVVVGAIAILLLYMAGGGMLPNGFGLFNMDDLTTRAVVFVILVVLTVLIGAWYFRGVRRSP